MLSWLLNGPLSLLFVLSGIVLNALCVLVFVRLRNAGSCSPPIIHYYLISLACWHSALLCNAFVLYCLPTLLWGSVISTGPYVHLYPPTYMLANATHTGTVWIVLALTLDRYLALCMPFKHRIFSKRSRVKRLVVGLSILAILFSLPRFFEVATAVECINTSKPQFPPTTKIPQLINNSSSSISSLILSSSSSSSPIIIECISYVQRTGLPQNQLYRSFYHILLGSTFVTILPGLLTFILTLRITIALGEAQRSRKRLSSHCEQQLLRCSSTNTNTNNEYKNIIKNCYNAENSEYGGKEEEKSTNILFNEKQQHKMMLLGDKKMEIFTKRIIQLEEHRANVLIVVIIVKFLISDILPTVLDVFETFIGNEAFMSSPMATLCVDFSNMLLVLNCSTNFWVFIFYVRGFRNRCARLLTLPIKLSPTPTTIIADGNESASCGVISPRITPQCSATTTGTLAINGGGATTININQQSENYFKNGFHIRDSSSISPKQQPPFPHSNRFNSINGCSLNTNKIINGNLNFNRKTKQINLLKRRACSLAIEQQQNNNNKITTNLSILPQQQHQNNIYLSQQPLAIISQQI
uniref:G-protein coupled receptors family 1 profile domain-containing protein n=1 Tax=Meloidogyne enterolobii TaxID=390850 RepID=A0A6V7XF29_MELEN|nr:unnamed protein product [Meloidogyne enterolobii]